MIETRFKNTELGELPIQWECIPLSKKVKGIFSGRNVSRSKNGKYPVLGSTGIIAYSDYFVFDYPAILVARVGANAGLVNRVEGKYDVTDNTLIIKPNSSRDFLFFQLRERNLNCMAYGSGQPLITATQLKKLFVINIPPSETGEENRIVEALSDVDDLISTLQTLIEKKRNIKQGVMQELLSGKRRLPGFKDEWEKKKIGTIGYTYNGLSGKSKEDFVEGNCYYITFLNILKNPIINEDIFERVYVSPSENQNEVLAGDLFFNTSSETPEEVGFCSTIINNVEHLYLNSFCFGFRLIDPNVLNTYLAYYFRSKEARILMSRLANGVTRFNLSKKKMKAASILLPPSREEQEAIVNVLLDMDSEISILEKRLDKYKALKQGMMQQLLTGKIRLI